MKKFFTFLIFIISLSSCKDSLKKMGREMATETRTENELKKLCSNSEVKNIIISSIKEEMIVNLTMYKMEGDLNFASLFLEPLQQYSDKDLSQNLRNKMEAEIRKFLNGQETNLDPNEISIIKESLKQVDYNFKELNGTRPTNLEPDLKKCDCKGNLELINDYNYSFEYSVQETDTHYFTELLGFSEIEFEELVNYLNLKGVEKNSKIDEENLYEEQEKMDDNQLWKENKTTSKIGNYTVKSDKSPFYAEPSSENKKTAYLVKGDKIKISKISENGIYGFGVFENKSGQLTKGWHKLNNLSYTNNLLDKYKFNQVLQFDRVDNEPVFNKEIPTNAIIEISERTISVNLGFGNIIYQIISQNKDLENPSITIYDCFEKNDPDTKCMFSVRENNIVMVKENEMFQFINR